MLQLPVSFLPACSRAARARTDGVSPLPDQQTDAPLIDELKTLGDEARAYAEAEIAFQKSRAAVALKGVKNAAIFIVAGLIFVLFALVALVVGLLLALVPYVGHWGALGIVVGGFVLLTIGSILFARSHWRRMMKRVKG